MEFLIKTLIIIYTTLVLGTILKFRIKGVPAHFMHVAFVLPVIVLLWTPISVALEQNNSISSITRDLVRNIRISFSCYPVFVGSSAERLARRAEQRCHIIGMIWPSFKDICQVELDKAKMV